MQDDGGPGTEGSPDRLARALPALADHACFLLYPVELPASDDFGPATLTLQALLADGGAPGTASGATAADALPWIVGDDRAALLAGGRVTPVWEPAALDVGADLHPHVQRMLGADVRGAPLALAFRLADLPLRLLQGKSLARPADTEGGAARRRLFLELSAQARRRLVARVGRDAPARLELAIAQVRLVAFRTRFAIVVVEVKFANPDRSPPHPYALVEAIVALARHNTLDWSTSSGAPAREVAAATAAAPATASPGGSFALADVLQSLRAAPAGGRWSRRVFTATYAQFAAAPAPAERRRYAIQLARHYSDHYRIAPAIAGLRFVEDFESVTHAMALEGCATIVDTAAPPGLDVPSFLANFRTATFERHYLPILLIAFHEYTALLYFTGDAKFWAGGEGADHFAAWTAAVAARGGRTTAPRTRAVVREQALARLERLRDDVLRFRLSYRCSQVSHVSMHNALYEGLRDAWGLERMAAELARDTAEIASFLEQAMARATSRQLRGLSTLGAGGIAFTATYAFLHAVEVLVAPHGWGALVGAAGSAAAGEGHGPVDTLVGIVAPVAVGLVAMWMAWRRTKHLGAEAEGDAERELEHELAHHATAEAVQHVAMNARRLP